MSTTLRDVAKLAGVSISTASRALYGSRSRPAAQETQERVWAAVHQLNYAPNDAAQNLGRRPNGKKTETGLGNIGLVLGNVSYKFADPFWTVVLQGIDREATRQEHHLRFAFTLEDLSHPHQRQLLSLEHIDGLIVVGGHASQVALDCLTDWTQDESARARTVIIEGGDDRFYRNGPLQFDVVTCDKRYIIYQMIDHLFKLGHRNIAFIGPAMQIEDRGAAFVQALSFHDLPYDPELYIESPWSTEGSYPYAQALLRSGKTFDAVMCGCDAIAISVMRAARERGMRLPDDLAIAGFDDIEFARHMHPALTTAHVQKELLGELAVRKLLERIKRPDLPPVLQMVPNILTIRESCGEQQALSEPA